MIDLGWAKNWSMMSWPSGLLSTSPTRVTMTPDVIETSSAGICDTRPSPIVRMPYFVIAQPISLPFMKTPTQMPPTMLIEVMMSPAIASPFTNFMAPSIAPYSWLSFASSLRRCLAVSWSIAPARMSASIDICLPGIASRVKRAATSETRSAPFAMTTNWTIVMMRKMTAPTMKLPPTTKLPNV